MDEFPRPHAQHGDDSRPDVPELQIVPQDTPEIVRDRMPPDLIHRNMDDFITEQEREEKEKKGPTLH